MIIIIIDTILLPYYFCTPERDRECTMTSLLRLWAFYWFYQRYNTIYAQTAAYYDPLYVCPSAQKILDNNNIIFFVWGWGNHSVIIIPHPAIIIIIIIIIISLLTAGCLLEGNERTSMQWHLRWQRWRRTNPSFIGGSLRKKFHEMSRMSKWIQPSKWLMRMHSEIAVDL